MECASRGRKAVAAVDGAKVGMMVEAAVENGDGGV